MMRGIVIIAGNAVTISSGTTAGAEIAVESEKIAIGSEGTGTKRRAANTSHLGGKPFPFTETDTYLCTNNNGFQSDF